MLDLDDTIVAIASPPGGAARGIVRASGPQMLDAVAPLFSADEPRALENIRVPTAIAGCLRLPSVPAPLPGTLYLWPSSRSYTRQPTAEWHTIGSPPLLQAIVDALCATGARPARPGEFTLRAFLAGRLDLTQAEAVLGVIDAQEQRQLTAALAQLAGGLATPLTRLRNELLDLLAHLEAGLDFVDEDIEFISADELNRRLQEAHEEVARLAEQMESRGEARDGVRAVLIGAANVGKTSLYNALAGQTALVSPQAGTTRDYLCTRLDLNGIVCELVDTAGVADEGMRGRGGEGATVALAFTAGPNADEGATGRGGEGATCIRVEARRVSEAGCDAAINRAAQLAASDERDRADIEILCLDATRSLNGWEQAALRDSSRPRIVVLTKVDQCLACHRIDAASLDAIETSSVTGAGLDKLRERLRAAASLLGPDGALAVAGTAARCRDSLRQAATALAHAQELAAARQGEELVAAELRLALDALGQVVGAVYTDDVLDRIFSRFCIGK